MYLYVDSNNVITTTYYYIIPTIHAKKQGNRDRAIKMLAVRITHVKMYIVENDSRLIPNCT